MKSMFLLLLVVLALNCCFAKKNKGEKGEKGGKCKAKALCAKFEQLLEDLKTKDLTPRVEVLEAELAKLSTLSEKFEQLLEDLKTKDLKIKDLETRVEALEPEVVKSFSLVFPVESTTDFVLIHGLPNLQALTVSLWMKSDDQANSGTLASYAVSGQYNEIILFNYNDLKLFIGGRNGGSSGVSATDDHWHYICITWENTAGSWNIYKDGVREANGTGLQIGHVISAGGTITLGQEQDSVAGGFDANQSFRGEMAQFNVWNRVLDEQEIAEKAKSCDAGPGEDALKLSDIKSGVHGNVGVIQPSSCKQ